MATATIYSNVSSVLSWSQTTVDTSKTESSSTLVTNSSGATVYWTQGAGSGSFANTASLYCSQGTSRKTWNFSESSGGAARVTLTITGSGGGGGVPPQKQGEGPGQGQGQGQGND
jgi:hypothetical protein